jgi:predicted secreted protein
MVGLSVVVCSAVAFQKIQQRAEKMTSEGAAQYIDKHLCKGLQKYLKDYAKIREEVRSSISTVIAGVNSSLACGVLSGACIDNIFSICTLLSIGLVHISIQEYRKNFMKMKVAEEKISSHVTVAERDLAERASSDIALRVHLDDVGLRYPELHS